MDKTDPQDTLARTIWGESRGEATQGMSAVACVIMNRVHKGGWWGDDVCGVCLHPWQFSCWNTNDPNLPKLQLVDKTDPLFTTCTIIANNAINGLLTDFTNGATSYYDRRMLEPPEWAIDKIPCAIIGHHLFYNNV